MKRASAGAGTDAAHPAVCFHREVLTCMRWSAIRREFLEALQTCSGLRFSEPKKLWRHSQEALGKWVLSQVARDTQGDIYPQTRSFTDGAAAASSLLSPSSHHHHRHPFFFFPTRAMLPNGTYDEQLVRDISLKCEAPNDPSLILVIRRLLAEFDLAQRCEDAATEVAQEMEATNPSAYCAPLLSIIGSEEGQKRTASQRRVQGAISVLDIKWPNHIAKLLRRDCPKVSIPLAAYTKLDMCYRHFSDEVESARYARLDYDTRFALRAATLMLRYEGCLATGSLQLCADTRLKQHLHAAGYHVMDLCASPINAYMGSPKMGYYGGNPKGNDKNNNRDAGEGNPSSLESEDVPNHFCSAFPDTDCYFGSLGSALKFDVEAAYNSRKVNPEQRPLLLTLDVPYDEDLCEKLFLKLVADMQRVERGRTSAGIDEMLSPPPSYAADYVLVLPLWWDVPMQCEKLLFTETGIGSTDNAAALPAEKTATLRAIIADRSAILQDGYKVSYGWPLQLAAAAGKEWVCFDAVFVGGSYEYFCTATNKWLSGVTATEVIGLAQPQARRPKRENDPSLKTLLADFYRLE